MRSTTLIALILLLSGVSLAHYCHTNGIGQWMNSNSRNKPLFLDNPNHNGPWQGCRRSWGRGGTCCNYQALKALFLTAQEQTTDLWRCLVRKAHNHRFAIRRYQSLYSNTWALFFKLKRMNKCYKGRLGLANFWKMRVDLQNYEGTYRDFVKSEAVCLATTMSFRTTAFCESCSSNDAIAQRFTTRREINLADCKTLLNSCANPWRAIFSIKSTVYSNAAINNQNVLPIEIFFNGVTVSQLQDAFDSCSPLTGSRCTDSMKTTICRGFTNIVYPLNIQTQSLNEECDIVGEIPDTPGNNSSNNGTGNGNGTGNNGTVTCTACAILQHPYFTMPDAANRGQLPYDTTYTITSSQSADCLCTDTVVINHFVSSRKYTYQAVETGENWNSWTWNFISHEDIPADPLHQVTEQVPYTTCREGQAPGPAYFLQGSNNWKFGMAFHWMTLQTRPDLGNPPSGTNLCLIDLRLQTVSDQSQAVFFNSILTTLGVSPTPAEEVAFNYLKGSVDLMLSFDANAQAIGLSEASFKWGAWDFNTASMGESPAAQKPTIVIPDALGVLIPTNPFPAVPPVLRVESIFPDGETLIRVPVPMTDCSYQRMKGYIASPPRVQSEIPITICEYTG